MQSKQVRLRPMRRADSELLYEWITDRDLLILKALMLHHVAPMARGISDREEDRFVLVPGSPQCLGTPRVPVDGVLGMLQQVRTRLVCEAVGHGVSWRMGLIEIPCPKVEVRCKMLGKGECVAFRHPESSI